MNCPQMIKIENQKLLARIQEGERGWYFTMSPMCSDYWTS